MASTKYTLFDPEGNEAGFVVLKSNEFEATTPFAPTLINNRPIDEALLTLAQLGGFTAVAGLAAWWAGGPGWIAPVTGLGLSVALAALKIVLNAPPQQAVVTTQEEQREIKATLTTNGKSQQIGIFPVSERALAHCARCIVSDGQPFSRRALKKAGIFTETDYNLIRKELIGRGWLDVDPASPTAGGKLNCSGQAIMRAIHRDLAG